MKNNILRFVSGLVGGCVGGLKKTDQQTDWPTDRLYYSFCNLTFDILFSVNSEINECS